MLENTKSEKNKELESELYTITLVTWNERKYID